MIGEQLGVKFVPIAYEVTPHSRAGVPGIMAFEVEGIRARQPVEIANVGHPMGSSLPIAKSVKGRYDDPD